MLAGNVLSRKAFPLKQKSCCAESSCLMNNMACPAASDFLSQTTCVPVSGQITEGSDSELAILLLQGQWLL